MVVDVEAGLRKLLGCSGACPPHKGRACRSSSAPGTPRTEKRVGERPRAIHRSPAALPRLAPRARRAADRRPAGAAFLLLRLVDRPGVLASGIAGRGLRPVARRRPDRAGPARAGRVPPDLGRVERPRPPGAGDRLAAGQRGADPAARVAGRRPAGAVPPGAVRDGPRHGGAGADAPVRARDPQLGHCGGARPGGDGSARRGGPDRGHARPARGEERQAGRDQAAAARVDERPAAGLHAGVRRDGHARAGRGRGGHRAPGAAASGRGPRPAGLWASRPRPHPARRDPGGRSRRAAAALPGLLNPRPASERTPVRLPVKARDLPARIATGGYILHSGLEKWHGDETPAKALHGMASNAFPVLQQIPPERFLRILAASEIAIGTALPVPLVPNAVAGAALTGFSGSLLAMYARTPAMRKPGSIWPSQAGVAGSKDVWMLGLGPGLAADRLTDPGEQ